MVPASVFLPRFALSLLLCVSASAAPIPPAALTAFETYLRSAFAPTPGPFLWAARDPARLASLQSGEIPSASLAPDPRPSIPHGLLHDWIAAVLIPGATLPTVLAVIQDYDHYQDFYAPTIAQSRLISHSPTADRFRLLYVHKLLFVTTTIDVTYLASYADVDASRRLSTIHSAAVAETHDLGGGPKTIPPADARNYLWNIASTIKLEQTPAGVVVEQRDIILSRALAPAFRWLFAPAIERASRDLLTASLNRTRRAALARATPAPR